MVKKVARRTAAMSSGLLLVAAVIGLVLTVGAASASVSAGPTVAVDGTIPQASGAMKKVIVLLRDRSAGLAAKSPARAKVVRAEVGPVAQALRSHGAKHLTSGTTLPFVLASVSSAQKVALESNPAVQAVFPDVVIPAPSPAIPAGAQLVSPLTGRSSAASAGPCGTAGNPEADPEALGAIHAPAAMKLGFDGAGVTVAYIAGPIDTTIPDFKRNAKYASSGSAAGSPVLTNVNFSGDPDNTQSGDDAGESFLDASSIAAQGNSVFDLNAFVGSAHPLPHPCDITITGTAPGANVIGLDVFSDKNSTTESNFIQAIQYAVSHGVKVLNESFGGNPFPDTALDVTRIADDQAVAAGVTVVTSTGDSGVTSTIGSPASDSNLINAGASTTFRAYKQLTFGGINATSPKASKGWLDNNIATISSAGFSQNGDNTTDLVAPGDSNWALCSPNTAVFTACTNFFDAPASIQFTGGTSESAPLTSGAVADVIQAYQSTHGGSSPSPALIKQILMSTATDIEAPAEQQGAGLLNIGAAVKEAQSINSTQRTGALLLSPNQINITHSSSASTPQTVNVTNTGSGQVTVHLSTRTLTRKVASHGGSLCLNPTSKRISCGRPTKHSFKIWSGVTEVYQEETFSVPHTGKKQSRLNFSANYPFTNQASLLHVALYDPKGAYAGYSDPQGEANYADVQVTNPKPGTWTAVFFTQKGNRTSQGTTGTTGKLKWRADTWTYGNGGTVRPASLTIAPGASKTATFKAKGPRRAGDVAQSIVLNSQYGTNTIPVTVRALVKVGAKGGSFSGLLSGGNGRGNPAQMNTYAFNVPSGKHDLDVSATLADTKDAVVAFLQDPLGNTVASSSNITLNGAGLKVVKTHTVTVYKDNPEAGRWTFVLDWLPPVVSAKAFAELSEPFTGKVQFNQVKAGSNLPKGATLTQGQSHAFHVTVKNTASTPETFFLDPRASGTTTIQLADQNQDGSDQNMPLPLASGTTFPFYLVPTETTALQTGITGSVPVTYDLNPLTGDPDVSPAVTAPGVTASQSGNTASLSLTGTNELAPGLWGLFASEVGPYPASGAPSATASASFKAVTQTFDSTVSTSTGDMWSLFNKVGAGNFRPVYLQPGKSATIRLTIVPTASPGTHVSGSIDLDDVFQLNAVTGFEFAGGDELASLPFTYTVG
jgi:hypothetical protein